MKIDERLEDCLREISKASKEVKRVTIYFSSYDGALRFCDQYGLESDIRDDGNFYVVTNEIKEYEIYHIKYRFDVYKKYGVKSPELVESNVTYISDAKDYTNLNKEYLQSHQLPTNYFIHKNTIEILDYKKKEVSKTYRDLEEFLEMDEAKKEIDYGEFNTPKEAQEVLERELADLDEKLSEIESEMPMIGPYDRPEYEAKADEISDRLYQIQDYASDEQYEYIEELIARCNSVPEIDYEGDERFDPYTYNGVKPSDFM